VFCNITAPFLSSILEQCCFLEDCQKNDFHISVFCKSGMITKWSWDKLQNPPTNVILLFFFGEFRETHLHKTIFNSSNHFTQIVIYCDWIRCRCIVLYSVLSTKIFTWTTPTLNPAFEQLIQKVIVVFLLVPVIPTSFKSFIFKILRYESKRH
jgi:hypothetical protein